MKSILLFIFLISYCVITHELGHFLFAKKFGIKVEEFAIGFGPILASKKKGETLYSIRWLPLGGFNRFANKEDPRSLEQTPVPQRCAVILAGPLFNFIFGYIAMLLYVLLAGYGWQSFSVAFATYGMLIKMTVSALIGLFTGKTGVDQLTSIVGIYSFTEGAVNEYGASVILNLAASLSVSLGISNLLPLTILDGGQLLYSIYEGIFKKKISDKVWHYAEIASLGVLLIIFVFTVGRDTIAIFK